MDALELLVETISETKYNLGKDVFWDWTPPLPLSIKWYLSN